MPPKKRKLLCASQTQCGSAQTPSFGPRPDVIQTSARRWPDAPDVGQTCQTSRLPHAARRCQTPKVPVDHVRTTSRHVQASTARRASQTRQTRQTRQTFQALEDHTHAVGDLKQTKYPHNNAQKAYSTQIRDCWVTLLCEVVMVTRH
eukprot:3419444-Prymnesium_polylepis.1